MGIIVSGLVLLLLRELVLVDILSPHALIQNVSGFGLSCRTIFFDDDGVVGRGKAALLADVWLERVDLKSRAVWIQGAKPATSSGCEVRGLDTEASEELSNTSFAARRYTINSHLFPVRNCISSSFCFCLARRRRSFLFLLASSSSLSFCSSCLSLYSSVSFLATSSDGPS